MKTLTPHLLLLALAAAAALIGCSTASTKSVDYSAGIRASLDQAGYKDVSVSQDRLKGVVTLGGHVASAGDKSQAESIATSIVADQVVANQIAVIPPGAEIAAREVNANLDKGIENNLKAALIMENLDKGVKSTVKNHVVTLSGEVDSPAKRARAEAVATTVPNVQQVVNTLQVKGQKATTSK